MRVVTSELTLLLYYLTQDAPDKIAKYVVQQFAKVLPNAPAARKSFVQCGGLQRVQQLKALDTANKLQVCIQCSVWSNSSFFAHAQRYICMVLQEYVDAINSCYPPDVVEHFQPNFGETLLKRVEEFQPR